MWFRQDLRLTDNAALQAACRQGGPVVCLFVLDEACCDTWSPGGASRWWLHHSLQSLRLDLAKFGCQLVLRRGSAAQIVPELAANIRAEAVHAGFLVEPFWRQSDKHVAEVLRQAGRRLWRHTGATLFPPHVIKTQAGSTYGIYTPFARATRSMPPPPAPLAIPDHIAPHAQLASDELAEWQLLPTAPDWAGGLRASWKPGELGARQQLEEFLRHAADAYAANRNVPGVRGTSRLSPHLHWGEISVGTVWHACQGDTPTAQTFLAELLWRDFAAYLLWHHPELPNAPLRPAFEKLPWRDAATDLGAWQRGLTGVPIVDAGMRELWQTGWMHNRVRMIVASFLCKHLLIDWRLGERWFWDTLVDADLASNAASWQWVAGTGIDSQPFFRVFNPVTQGEKFDPDGYYVRRFVPEIAGLPDRFLHAPWTAPDLVLRASGVTLGQTYPARLVDLNLGRTRALDIYTRTVRAA